MKPSLLSIFLLLSGIQLATAADSTFSKDNAHVFIIEDGHPALIDVDLQKRGCQGVDLSKTLGAPIRAVTLSNAGFVLCATKDALWAYDPSNGKCVKICAGPEQEAGKPYFINDIAYNPKTEEVLASCSTEDSGWGKDKLFCLPKNGEQWQVVRDGYAGHPIFSEDGTLFYVSGGDLWVGSVQKASADAKPNLRFSGYCYAPLAGLEVGNFNSSSTGLYAIAVSRGMIYGNFKRMGGSGWGSMIRFKRPVYPNEQGGPNPASPQDRAAYWKNLRAIFDSYEDIGGPQISSSLCTSRDGHLTFYTNSRAAEAFLVENDGKPAPIEIKGLTDREKE